MPLELPALAAAARARGVPVIGELELGWRAMEADVHRHHRHQRQDHHHRADRRAAARARPAGAGRRQHRHAAGRARAELPGRRDCRGRGVELPARDASTASSPRVAVVLNVTPDHLDRHGTFERYVDAKARIFANQTPTDCAVLNADDPVTAGLAAAHAGARALVQPAPPLAARACSSTTAGRGQAQRPRGARSARWPRSPLRGQHNVENVLAATACALWTRDGARAIRRGIARASAGSSTASSACATLRGVRLLQRLQGHQRRLHDQGARELRRSRSC